MCCAVGYHAMQRCILPYNQMTDTARSVLLHLRHIKTLRFDSWPAVSNNLALGAIRTRYSYSCGRCTPHPTLYRPQLSATQTLDASSSRTGSLYNSYHCCQHKAVMLLMVLVAALR